MYPDGATAPAELCHGLRLSPQAAARLARLEGDMPPGIFQPAGELLRDADEAGFNRAILAEHAYWRKLQAHSFGDILSVMHEHVRGHEMLPDCTGLDRRCHRGPEGPSA